MNPVRVYDFSFVSKDSSNHGAPEIVISIQRDYFDPFQCGLFRSLVQYEEGVKKYLAGGTSFNLCENGRYGYGSCCAVVEKEKTIDINFELFDFQGLHLTASLHVITNFLNILLGQHPRAEPGQEEQYLQLSTLCGSFPHGHSVSGWVFPAFGKWLETQGCNLKKPDTFSMEAYLGSPFVPRAKVAMEETWEATAEESLRKYKEDCWVGIMEYGRFLLHCHGDACDIAVYPDQCSRGDLGRTMVQFSSHNVDAHTQQLTLIAGLAELINQARVENERV